MAKVKLTDDRSTYWVATGTNTPSKYGDYRYYWKFYYEQTDDNKKNNTSKLIIDQYIQVYFTESHPDDWMASGYTYYPSSSGNVSIDGAWQTAKSNAQGTIQLGEAYNLYYQTTYTKTISHNADGTRSFKWQGTGFGKYTAVSTYSFPQILRPTVIGSVANFDIDNGVSIPVTKYVSSYYNVLEIYSGNSVFKTINDFTKDIAVNTSVSIPVVFTETELDNIYTEIPKGETATFTFKLTTYTNSSKTTKIGDSTKTATGEFTIQLPGVYGGICTDAFDSHVNLTGDTTKQTIIKGQSYIKIEIPTNMQAVANTRKATIAEYVVDDVHIPYSANGVSKLLSTSNSSKDHVIIYAVDSRGTSSLPYTQKFTKYIDYNRVSLNTKNYKFERQNNGISRFIDTSFEGTWFSGNFGAKQNSLTPFVYYRVNEGQIWNDLNEFVDGASIGRLDMSKLDTSTPGIFKYDGPIMSAESDTGFDVKNSYDIFFGFMDELSNNGFTLTINYGEPAAAIYKNKMALGGPYDETLGGTQLWDDVYLNGQPLSSGGSQKHSVSAMVTENTNVTTTSSYQRVYIVFGNHTKTGSKLTFNSSKNTIIIGEGVSKVTVSATCSFVWNGKEAGELGLGITKNGTSICSATGHKPANYMVSLSISPCDIDVVAGDEIQLYTNMNESGLIGYIRNNTYLRVEVLE